MKSPSSWQILSLSLFAALVVTGTSTALNAEIPARPKEQLHESASHVIHGTVQRVYGWTEKQENFNHTYWVAEIAVERVDKGTEIAVGDRVFVRYWALKYTVGGFAPPNHYGHWNRPTVNDIAEIYVSGDRKTGFDVLSPNGFFEVKKPAAAGSAPNP